MQSHNFVLVIIGIIINISWAYSKKQARAVRKIYCSVYILYTGLVETMWKPHGQKFWAYGNCLLNYLKKNVLCKPCYVLGYGSCQTHCGRVLCPQLAEGKKGVQETYPWCFRATITDGYFIGMLRFSMPRLVRHDRQVVDVFRHVHGQYMSSGVNKMSGGTNTSYGCVLCTFNTIDVCFVKTRWLLMPWVVGHVMQIVDTIWRVHG